jgi:hypothetical protein
MYATKCQRTLNGYRNSPKNLVDSRYGLGSLNRVYHLGQSEDPRSSVRTVPGQRVFLKIERDAEGRKYLKATNDSEHQDIRLHLPKCS